MQQSECNLNRKSRDKLRQKYDTEQSIGNRGGGPARKLSSWHFSANNYNMQASYILWDMIK